MSRVELLAWVRRQALEQRAAAAVRAMAQRPQVHFEGGRPWDGNDPLPDHAPHLQANAALENLAAYRGLADGLTQRLLLSDPEVYASLCPSDDPVAALTFEWLEQLRVETLAPRHWPGMQRNIQQRFDQWSELFLGSGQVETSVGRIVFCFAQMAWQRMSGRPIPEPWIGPIESTIGRYGARLAGPLRTLAASRLDQAAYGAVALELARQFSAWIGAWGTPTSTRTSWRQRNFSISLPPLVEDQDDGGSASGVAAGTNAPVGRYTVWTRRYDIIEEAQTLVRSAQLVDYRQHVDRLLEKRRWPVGHFARLIRRMLEQQQVDGWLFEQEDGYIDGRRLAQLISSPDDHAIFYRDRTVPAIRARVILLIDCSGSMKYYRSQLAVMMDVLSRAFERAEVPFETLGFTTRAWNGGRAVREWQALRRRTAGPPGRLNELHHLVFSSPEMPRRQRRLAQAAILKPDLFRESVDGEAVQWACSRLNQADSTQRRILWVLSDGGPMDTATVQANPPGLLDAHLRQVVRDATQQGVEVLGIGVGQDMTSYYTRAVPLDLEAGLDVHDITSLIRQLYRGRTRQRVST